MLFNSLQISFPFVRSWSKIRLQECVCVSHETTWVSLLLEVWCSWLVTCKNLMWHTAPLCLFWQAHFSSMQFSSFYVPMCCLVGGLWALWLMWYVTARNNGCANVMFSYSSPTQASATLYRAASSIIASLNKLALLLTFIKKQDDFDKSWHYLRVKRPTLPAFLFYVLMCTVKVFLIQN